MLPNLLKVRSVVSQPLEQLSQYFAELVDPSHARAILLGPCLGYNVGSVENRHGNPLAGKVNMDFVVAMYALQSNFVTRTQGRSTSISFVIAATT